jgi:hypothetical protein
VASPEKHLPLDLRGCHETADRQQAVRGPRAQRQVEVEGMQADDGVAGEKHVWGHGELAHTPARCRARRRQARAAAVRWLRRARTMAD